jgi:hypothetical protein
LVLEKNWPHIVHWIPYAFLHSVNSLIVFSSRSATLRNRESDVRSLDLAAVCSRLADHSILVLNFDSFDNQGLYSDI